MQRDLKAKRQISDAPSLAHTLERIQSTAPSATPFRHLYIEDIFSSDFYDQLHAYMLCAKSGDAVQERRQDSPHFVNKRFSLVDRKEYIVDKLREMFNDFDLRRALISKFYNEPIDDLVQSLAIHNEFEFFFTKAGRFQEIHVDIPPKYLSLVFYLPEVPFTSKRDEEENATIFYDKDLVPHRCAAFRPNSACVFAPHFHSYHGFDSTRDRDVLVMFLVKPDDLDSWRERRRVPETHPFHMIRDVILEKLARYPLIEFGSNSDVLRREFDSCRINAEQGRVIRR